MPVGFCIYMPYHWAPIHGVVLIMRWYLLILSATRIPPGPLSGKVFWSYCMHRWYCFLLMRWNLMVIVDIAGMDGPCSNILSFCGSGGIFRRLWGSFLRLWVSFLMYFWYPDGQMVMNGHRCRKREPFSTKKSSNRASFGPPFLLKIDVFLVFLMVQLWVGI